MRPRQPRYWRLIEVMSRYARQTAGQPRPRVMTMRVPDRDSSRFRPRTERTHVYVSVPFVAALTRPACPLAAAQVERMRVLPATDWERRWARRRAAG